VLTDLNIGHGAMLVAITLLELLKGAFLKRTTDFSSDSGEFEHFFENIGSLSHDLFLTPVLTQNKPRKQRMQPPTQYLVRPQQAQPVERDQYTLQKHIETTTSALPASLLSSLQTLTTSIFTVKQHKTEHNNDSTRKLCDMVRDCLACFYRIYELVYHTDNIVNIATGNKVAMEAQLTVMKHMAKFNSALNRIKQSLRKLNKADEVSVCVLRCHELISGLPFFDTDNVRFENYAPVPVSIAPAPVKSFASTPKKHKNWDDEAIGKDHTTAVRLGEKGSSCVFGTTFEEMLNLLRFGLTSKVTHDSIVVEQLPVRTRDPRLFGSILHENVRFSLMIPIPHPNAVGGFVSCSSSDIKLAIALSGKTELTHKLISKYGFLSRSTPCLSDYDFRFIIEADKIIQEHIFRLINLRHSISLTHHDVPFFQYRVCRCYREECKAQHIYTVNSPAKQSLRCSGCRIASFCSLCSDSDHGGDCTQSIDEQSSEVIGAITKPCPSCPARIQMIDGCNHMKCTSCKTHFCWICAAVFQPAARVPVNPDDINESMAQHWRITTCRQFNHR
jgi:hypothetical protein